MSAPESVVVFAGPSLPPEDRPKDTVYDWRPPAAAGDILRLSTSTVRGVVLIDGVFDERPAVRHKELLEVLAEGVAVVGGASMGALRAAELAAFGMVGVGRIFEAFASGRLTDDAEVAVSHGPPDWDCRPLTEPLVNVRATLIRSVIDGRLKAAEARRVLGAARSIFYKDRTWGAILERLEADGGLPLFHKVLRADLEASRVDLKRQDARLCLTRALDAVTFGPTSRPRPPRTVFTTRLLAEVDERAETSQP